MNKHLLPLGLAIACCLAPAKALDLDKFAPKSLPVSSGIVKPDSDEHFSEGDSAVLIKELRAIICHPNQETFQASNLNRVEGVQLNGIHAPNQPQLIQLLRAYIGKPLTLAAIGRLNRDIVLFYRKHDHPVVDVIVPEQDITSGVLQLVVLESRLGEVRAEGNRWFSSSMLTSEIKMHPGDSILGSRVEADLRWLSSNPFRLVSLLYTPGKAAGTTDLVLETKDRFPFRIYAGTENTGNASTGDERWLTGFNWGNAFGLDHQLSYQFTASGNFQSLRAHSVTYEAPLPWHHMLTLLGTYTETSSNLLSTGQLFNAGGYSEQASLRYKIPVRKIGPITHDVFAGFDFKRTNNNLQFGGTAVYDTSTNIFQWLAGYDASEKDRWGTTSINTMVVFSPGNIDPENTTPVFQQAEAGAKSGYLYGQFRLERATRLPGDFSLVTRGSYQWSDATLLPSEQLALGGYNSVRGYEEDQVRGDSGLLFSMELLTPPLNFVRQFTGASKGWKIPLDDQLQFLCFWDYGMAQLRSPAAGAARRTALSGAGVGFRYSLNTCLSLRFDYGWQLTDPGTPRRFDSRASFGLVVSY